MTDIDEDMPNTMTHNLYWRGWDKYNRGGGGLNGTIVSK